MRKGGVRGPLPQENEGRGRRGVDPSGSRRSRRDRQLAPHPPHRCLLRSRFAVEGRTLRLDSLGLAFFSRESGGRKILLKRSAREGDRWWRMGASRATWTLAFSIVSVGAAIALVHGMQTEERRRLHQVGIFPPTNARTHASPPPQQTTWCCPADGGAVSPTDTPSLLERLRLRLLLRIHTL